MVRVPYRYEYCTFVWAAEEAASKTIAADRSTFICRDICPSDENPEENLTATVLVQEMLYEG